MSVSAKQVSRGKKIYLSQNVFKAAISRIEWMFDTFPHVCISFSGGKDSTVLLHLAGEVARRRGEKFSVLFVDWEAQFSYTIEHIQQMKAQYSDVINHFYWVALPLTTVNGLSQHQPEWIAWEKGKDWVRKPPVDAITDEHFFPFYYHAMTFEEFVPAFSAWLSQGEGLITATGVRTDESFNRFIGVASLRKLRYAPDKPWTTSGKTGFYYTACPLYDWKVSDIWIYNARTHAAYNPLYDLMYRAGVSLRAMRICEPFGPEQRRGLWLYHVLEPETWSRMCSRVAGTQSGAIYANQSGSFYALNNTLIKPGHLNWQQYALFLLDSMPGPTSEHYKNKIAIYLKWYSLHGYPYGIPDEQDKDLGCRDIPSWRRVCKTLLKNDFWCRTLSFCPNKPKHYERYKQRIQKKRAEWGLL